MKKFLFSVICAAAFFIMALDIMNYKSEPILSQEENGYRESFNSEANMKMARAIAYQSEAKRVAVIGGKDGVLIGISLPSGVGNRSKIREEAEKTAKKQYPKSKIVVEIQTDKAEDIISLASYLEKGIPHKILKLRERYLLKTH